MGRIIYPRKALINAVRVVVLVARNWDPFASGEGWKVYLAEDLGILALAVFFFLVTYSRFCTCCYCTIFAPFFEPHDLQINYFHIILQETLWSNG